ncbi:hypothetical protein BBJ28_00009596 [Nothophytophthora sp. Chile5]|nr:hypothetical protein BBJ28_00009596 [Nothophytophthora sp. Chile5]
MEAAKPEPLALALTIDAIAVEAVDATGNEAAMGGDKATGLITEEVVATPEGYMHLPQELASPASMPELLAAADALGPDGGTDPGALEADAKISELNQDENGEKSRGGSVAEEDESEEHATIKAVAESADKSPPLDANLGETSRVHSILTLARVASIDTGIAYNWVHEIEVTFGQGRLGLNLKQIAGLPGTEFSDIQVHIAEIYKMLARMQRPVRIKFADFSKGIVAGVMDPNAPEASEAQAVPSPEAVALVEPPQDGETQTLPMADSTKVIPEKDESVTADEDEEVDATPSAAPDVAESAAGEGEVDATTEQSDAANSTAESVEELDPPLTIVAPVAADSVEEEEESTPMGADPAYPLALTIDADAVEAVDATGNEAAMGGDKATGLITEEVVATPEGYMHLPQELASPASMPELLAAADALGPDGGTDPGALEADAKISELNQDENGEKSRGGSVAEEDESEEHATIKAVAESADKSPPLDANLGETSRVHSILILARVASIDTGIAYNWVHEIEVTFGQGRLGLNLKQIAGLPGTEFSDIQVHIAEIYKMLTRMQRPVRIKFADISKGIVGRVAEELPHEETEEVKEARAARVMQSSLRMEYFRILVAYELHQQVWGVAKSHMQLKEQEMQKKCEVMATQVEGQQQLQESLEKERENLIQEAASLEEMIKQLDLQAAGQIESPEVLKSTELVLRSAELEKEIAEIIAENDELQASRIKIEESLDLLQKDLDEYGDLEVDQNGHYEIKFFSPAFLGSMVQRGSIDTRAEDARDRLLEKVKAQGEHLGEEITMEEERAKFVESEIHQFQKQMDVAAAASKREDDFISGERPPQMIFLENKIALLRKNLRETVAGMVKASNSGDRQQADNLSLRRADLKDDLKTALDEMHRMEGELNVFWDVDERKTVSGQQEDAVDDTVDIDLAPEERVSESSRLQNKLAKLKTQLHDTVIQLAKAASDKDEERKNELSTQRLQLKDEMKVVQDQFQVLANGTRNEAVQAKDLYMRPSIAGPPSMQDFRGSISGNRASLGGNRASLGGNRASVGGARASVAGLRGSERFDPNRSRRSSSSASIGSLTQSFNSNSNQVPAPKDGAMPTMSGLLRKHPTHSNEKGAFGNMSLRGVRERWCVIESDGNLRYYKRQGDREPRGAIPLKHKSLEILHGKEVGKPNEFMICSPTHQTRLVAKSHEEMLRWVKALEVAHQYFFQQTLTRGGSIDSLQHQESVSSSTGSVSADQPTSATSPSSMDPELAYRNKRATLGF